MIRNIKALGLAVVAILALGAISASAASAVEFHSEVENTKYTATAEGSQVTVNPAGTTTCTGLTFEATTTKTTNPTITATNVRYTGGGPEGQCIDKTIFGNLAVSVDFATDECDYGFHANGELDIECKKTGGVKISQPGCTMTLPTQTGVKTVTYDNKEAGTNRGITFTMTFKGIQGSASGFMCSKEGPFTTGEYTGNVTFQGFKDEAGGAQAGIWVE